MAVALPSSPPAMDFDRPAPFLSAPSSPSRFRDLCYSAPLSPSRISEFYRGLSDDFDGLSLGGSGGGRGSPSAVPFSWEETPGTPKSPKSSAAGFDDDFAFDLGGGGDLGDAAELFDRGKIRPLKPPPCLQQTEVDKQQRPRSPRSPIAQGKRMIREAFSPKQPRRESSADPMGEFDPFAAAAEAERGRERGQLPPPASRSGRRGSRSMSPYRVEERAWEEEVLKNSKQSVQSASKGSTSSASSLSSSSSKGYRKWRLRDFLLFRSASEGDKDRLKYTFLWKKQQLQQEERSGGRGGGSISRAMAAERSGSGSVSRRRGQVSAHELHYTVNRAVSEDMKKKTFLPYRKNIFGFGPFNRK